MRIALIAFSISTTFLCCDPSRRITMINTGVDTAHIIWTAREDNLTSNPFILSNSRELKFTLLPGKNKEVKLTFGEGSWSEEYISSFVRHLEAIEIVTGHSSVKLDSLDAIKNYFMAHRKKSNVVEVVVQ